MEIDQKFEEELGKYSNSFSVAGEITKLTKGYLELKIKDLNNELDAFESQMEKCRAYNLISFLKFFIGNQDDALAYNQKSLNLYPDNIIGLCNRGWILLKTEQRYDEIRQICQTLSDTKGDTLKMIVAKAEVAYTYARLGIQFYNRACEIYHDVLSNAVGLNVEDNICSWSFGCALARARLFKTLNVCNETDLVVTQKHCESVFELCRNIIKTVGQSNFCKLYIPRAYVLLGVIMDDIKTKGSLRDLQIQELLPDDPDLHMTADEYFDKAFKLQEDDTFVLDRCGRHFESSETIDKSILFFRKTIDIKPTSFSHHHLAVALKIKLESKAGNCMDSTAENQRKCETEPNGNDVLANKTIIKSPKIIQYIDLEENKEAVVEIIEHLDDANKLADNIEAIYDKGLIFRQTNQSERALDTFKSLLSKKRCSLVLRANVYEQLGFCILHSDSLKSSMKEDMKMYFKKSLEISCNIVANIPELAKCWDTAPTLESLLLMEAKTKNNLEDLLFLYKKIEAFGDVIDVLSSLLEKASREGEKAGILHEMIEHYWKMKKFDDAGVVLGMLMCLPTWTVFIKKEIYIPGNVEAAMDAYYTGDKEVARIRFDHAFEFCRKDYAVRQPVPTDDDDEGLKEVISKTDFRVCILCDPKNEDNGMKILETLSTLGLTATLNTLNTIEYGKTRLQILERIVKKSNHFLIIYDFEHDSERNDGELMYMVEMTMKIILRRGHGNFLTLVSDKTKQSDVPSRLPNTVSYNFENDVDYGDIQKLLVCLATGDTEISQFGI